MAVDRRLQVPSELAGVERHHRATLDRLFVPKGARPRLDRGLRFLFLCFTNRCGSNYLAELLASTGALNRPEEVFNGETMEEHVRAQGLQSFPAYMDFLCRRLALGGWFTAKLGLEQLLMLAETGLLDEIGDRARFLLIERQDKLAQAISLLVAIQTQQWTSRQARRMPDEALVYDRRILEDQQALITQQNFGFYRFFASNGLVPFHLAYEPLVAAPHQTVAEIGRWLGLPGLEARPDAVPIARQESPVKAAWRARYVAGG
ncbi:Stf0 family sulfotransferase [Acidisoma sp. 7E03]